jgi:hypothetical protein
MTSYERERLVAHRYFVLVAHTKTNLDFEAIDRGVRRLRDHPEVEVVTLSELARTARAELARTISRGRDEEAER